MQRVYMNRAYTDPKGDGGGEQYRAGSTYPVDADKAEMLLKSGAAQVVPGKKKPKASKRAAKAAAPVAAPKENKEA